MGVDSAGKGIIYLSETIANVYKQQPDKFKMEIKSSRVSGSNSFGFTFPAFINMYENNVTVFSDKLNPRGFISPVADGALGYYKFKFLGSFFENGKEINTIKVTPRRMYEPLFSGVIYIIENEWRIHSYDLTLTKKSQLELIDTLQIRQLYAPVYKDNWMAKNQLLSFTLKQFGFDITGRFLSVYSDYNLSPAFGKKFFDKIIIEYDTAVIKRQTYWDSIRPVVLEPEEIKDYKVKDSINLVTQDSLKKRANLDSLNKKQKPLNFISLLRKDYYHTHYSLQHPYTWGIKGIIPNLEYNSVEGVVTNIQCFYSFYSKGIRTRVQLDPTVRYGFGNTHLNAWLRITLHKRDSVQSNRSNIGIDFGKRVSEFNKSSTIIPLYNTISTLFYGHNYLKLYENNFGQIQYSKYFENGFSYFGKVLYEDRTPLNNTSLYTFTKEDKVKITPNYPIEKLNAPFSPHQALSITLGLRYQPGQRFIKFPKYKSSIGSKMPVFSLRYTKGIKNLLGSDVDYDKWTVGIDGHKNFRLLGKTDYTLHAGGFLRTKYVPIQDYQHFNGNRMLTAGPYLNSFQLAPYYANSTISRFYTTAHIEHHFNGLITNKIPLFKKLNWNLVAGSNAFYVNQNNNYIEVFAGIENIFKIFRIDFIAAYENGNKGLTGVRIGLGGLLGGSMQVGTLQKRFIGNF